MNGRPVNDPELDALLGAYALDAVDQDERARVEAYLEANRTARHEVDDLRESAASLALVPHDDLSAPADLWDRISSTIAEQDRVVTRLRPRWRPSATALLAIAASIVIVVLGASVIALSGRSTRSGDLASAFAAASNRNDARHIALRAPNGGPDVARVVLLPDGTGYLQNESMRPLAPALTYQLWALTGDPAQPTAISSGVLGADPHVVAFHAPVGAHGLGITVEHAPGVASSTQPMYAAANFA